MYHHLVYYRIFYSIVLCFSLFYSKLFFCKGFNVSVIALLITHSFNLCYSVFYDLYSSIGGLSLTLFSLSSLAFLVLRIPLLYGFIGIFLHPSELFVDFLQSVCSVFLHHFINVIAVVAVVVVDYFVLCCADYLATEFM